jgi:hypothetical protein
MYMAIYTSVAVKIVIHPRSTNPIMILRGSRKENPQKMKKISIREVETLKTTAAFYGGSCCGCPPVPVLA